MVIDDGILYVLAGLPEPGAKIIGPAIVEERESTVVIGVGGLGIVDKSGALVVSIDG